MVLAYSSSVNNDVSVQPPSSNAQAMEARISANFIGFDISDPLVWAALWQNLLWP